MATFARFVTSGAYAWLRTVSIGALLPPYWRRPVRLRPMRLTGRLGALQEKQFRLLWAGQAVSAFGDGLYPVALAFAVVELTGSAADLGLVFMAVLIPRVVLVLGGGVWADRLAAAARDARRRRAALRDAGADGRVPVQRP